MGRSENDTVTRTGRSAVSLAEADRPINPTGTLVGGEPLIGQGVGTAGLDVRPEPVVPRAQQEEQAARSDEAPALTPATLAEQHGVGVLRLVWDADGNVIETMGSWRPQDDVEAWTAPRAGERARFVGTLYIDAARSVPIETEVVITGGGVYTDVSGNEVRLVRFGAPDLVGDERFAMQAR